MEIEKEGEIITPRPRQLPCNIQAYSCLLPHVVDPGSSPSFWFVLSLEFPFD